MKISMKAARVNKNLSQKDLGQMLDKSEFTIANWESGKTQPRIGDFDKLCTILEVSKSDIILSDNQE